MTVYRRCRSSEHGRENKREHMDDTNGSRAFRNIYESQNQRRKAGTPNFVTHLSLKKTQEKDSNLWKMSQLEKDVLTVCAFNMKLFPVELHVYSLFPSRPSWKNLMLGWWKI